MSSNTVPFQVQVVNQSNQLPIAGATVNFNGRPYTTDASGMVNLVAVNVAKYGSQPLAMTVTAPTYKPYDGSDFQDISELVKIGLVRDSSYFANFSFFSDAQTSNPLAQAKIYVNSNYVGTTDGTGQVWVTGPVGTVTVHVVGVGYDSTFSQTATGPQGFPTRVLVQPLAPQSQTLTFVTTPGDAQLYLSDNSTPPNLLEYLQCGSGSAQTSGKYMPATYSVRATKSGFNDSTTTVAVQPGVAQYAVQGPTVAASNGNTAAVSTGTAGQATATPGDSTPASPDLLANSGAPPSRTTTANADYEWIYPNSDDGKYFTASQARVYVGNLFVDELNSLQFTFQGNRIPVFGYCSAKMDAAGTGKHLVQGQLALNFISEGYLYTLLEEFQSLRQSGKAASGPTAQEQQLANLVTQQGSPSDGSSNSAALAALVQQQILQLAGKVGPDGIDNVKTVLANAQRLTTTQNAILLDIPFDVVAQFTGAGRTVTRTLKNCLLTSNDQIYDQSGAPLLDCYGFIAQDLR